MAGKIKELTVGTFDDTIKNGKVLVDFWASWCGPCRMQLPIIESMADKYNQVTFTKVNVDEEGGLAARYGIMSIPSLLVFENGLLVKTMVGVQNEGQLKNALGL